MKIKKLSFNSTVWGRADKAVSFKMNRIDAENAVIEYSKGGCLKLKFILSGDDLLAFNQRFKKANLEKWENTYTELVLDGEEWDIQLEFSNRSKREIVGLNGYPKDWNCFLALVEWVKAVGENMPELTYEEAKQKALSINHKVNFCREYFEAYHFSEMGGEAKVHDDDVVVIKRSGKTFNFVSFVVNLAPEHNAKTIKF